MEKPFYNNNTNLNNSNNYSNNEIININEIKNKRDEIESLFLYQNFQTVVIELIDLLLKLYGPPNRLILSENNKQDTYESLIINQDGNVSLSPKLLEICSQSFHDCRKGSAGITNDNTSEQCQCQWIMELLIQSLYELGKPSDGLKLVNRFYLDGIPNTPIEVLILSINLLVYLKSYHESKVIIMGALERNRNEFDRDQYEQLVELLIFHVMFRMNEIQESIEFLKNDQYLVDWKKEGFIKSLLEMVQIRETEEKNQREQLLKKEIEQQQQQKLKQEQQEKEQQQQLQLQQQAQQLQQEQQEQQTSSLSTDQSIPKSKSIIENFKEFFMENLNELLLIKDFNTFKLAINRIVFGNSRKMIYYIFNQIKLIYLKTKLFYLKRKPLLKKILPPILFLTLVFTIKYLMLNNNKNNQNKTLINTKKLQISNNNGNTNRRTFGIRPPPPIPSNNSSSSINRSQPYRNSIHYQQHRQQSGSLNSNGNNSNTTASWNGLKQLLSNTFSFNRV